MHLRAGHKPAQSHTTVVIPFHEPVVFIRSLNRAEFPGGSAKLAKPSTPSGNFRRRSSDRAAEPASSRVSAVAFLRLHCDTRRTLTMSCGRYRSAAGFMLHAFPKKSKKGIETPKPDVDLIKKRYTEAAELARE
jgi:hypothetical protein